MKTSLQSQRGEGKIGCIIMALVFIIGGGVAFKAVPVFYANQQLVTECEEMAVKAGILPNETLVKQLLAKAKELEIPEALAPGAIQLEKVPVNAESSSGVCKITLHYSRKIDFYGLFTYTLVQDKTLNRDYMDVR